MCTSLRTPRNASSRVFTRAVSEFDKYLIFYLPRPDGVSLVRVLHAAQDWWDLLGVE